MSMAGKVIRVVRDKGFGFITDNDGTEYFFHRTGVVPDAASHQPGWEVLQEGDKVTFDQEESPKGPRASNIRKLK